MVRVWIDEYPSCYLAGDLDTARQASVAIPLGTENRLAPLLEETSDTVTETGPGLPGASSSSSSGPRPGEVFAEEEPGDATGSGAGMAEAQISAEKEEEYRAYLEYLSKVRTPATKIEYRENRDGSREYVVHFSAPISSFHSIQETKTLMFKAAGRHGVLHYGDDRAAALAFTAYTASLHTTDANLRFGCGSLKLDGFHGDARGEFYVYHSVTTYSAQRG